MRKNLPLRMCFFSYKKSNDPGRNFLSVESLNGEFLFSSLHLLPHIYPIFTCVDTDPYSEYGSGSTKLVNKDPILSRIQHTNYELSD